MKVKLISDLHRQTVRRYLARMTPDKPYCMKVARQYGQEYWDGDRKFGYGGYRFDNRWVKIARRIVKRYKITEKSKVLDIGCGKGFLGYTIKQLTKASVTGIDISKYALAQNPLTRKYEFDFRTDVISGSWGLILCINVLHNLLLPDLKGAVKMIAKSGKQAYICVDSYRNEQELFNLQCWSLTCEQFFRPEEWEFLFKQWGYRGDYEFIYFE